MRLRKRNEKKMEIDNVSVHIPWHTSVAHVSFSCEARVALPSETDDNGHLSFVTFVLQSVCHHHRLFFFFFKSQLLLYFISFISVFLCGRFVPLSIIYSPVKDVHKCWLSMTILRQNKRRNVLFAGVWFAWSTWFYMPQFPQWGTTWGHSELYFRATVVTLVALSIKVEKKEKRKKLISACQHFLWLITGWSCDSIVHIPLSCKSWREKNIKL